MHVYGETMYNLQMLADASAMSQVATTDSGCMLRRPSVDQYRQSSAREAQLKPNLCSAS